MSLSRRTFCQTLGAASAAVAVPKSSYPYCKQFKRQPFGKTGLTVSPVGLSASHLHFANSKMDADAMIRYMLDCGVNYFEASPNYGAGIGEEIMGSVLHSQRDDVIIAAKTRAVDYQSALTDLNDSLSRLQTDFVDVWMLDNPTIHNLSVICGNGGALAAAKKAKQAGKCRFVGISGQSHPEWLNTYCERYAFDVVQMPLNAVDPHFLSFEQEVLSQHHNLETAIVGSHTFALDALREQDDIPHEESLRYAMSLPVSTTLVNCFSKKQAVADMRAAFNHQPITEDEKAQILAKTESLSNRDVEWYKAIV